MNTLHLSDDEIISITAGDMLVGSLSNRFIHCHVSIFAEKIKYGDVFVAIDARKYDSTDGCLGFSNNEDSVFGFGGRKDGHDDIGAAIQNGATTVILDKEEKVHNYDNKNVNYICVNDSLEALCKLSKYALQKSNVKTIAITGSVGKTSTASCLFQILSTRFSVLKSDYIRSTVLGIATEVLDKICNGYDFYIVELQSDYCGQINKLCQTINVDFGIITEITYSHLSKFKSIENILIEKTTPFDYLSSIGKIFINATNQYLYQWSKKSNDNRIATVGEQDFCDYYCTSANEFYVTLPSNNHQLLGTWLPSTHIVQIEQLLCFSFLEYLTNNTTSISEVNNLSKSIRPVFLRFNQFVGRDGCKVVLDSYNASYLSMLRGIEKVCDENCDKTIILVLGSMLELGNSAESLHRSIAMIIRNHKNIDQVFLIGESMLYAYFEIMKVPLLLNVFHSFSYEAIINQLLRIPLCSQHVVYIKGSGSMRMELVAPYVLSDMEI